MPLDLPAAVVPRFLRNRIPKPLVRVSGTEVMMVGTDVARRGRGGRKRKGDRIRTTVALPREVMVRAQQIADREHIPVTDVIGRLCAQALDIPTPAYCRPRTGLQAS